MKLYRAAAATLVFTACSCAMACLLALALHRLNQPIALFSFGIGLVVGVFAFFSIKAAEKQPPLTWQDGLMIVVFAVVSLRAFLWLAYRDGDRLMVLSPNNLGDLSLHWNYIRFLAAGCDFWPGNPLLAGSTIRYPIGVDLLNSLLVLCGVDTLRSLVWVGLIGCLLTGVALFRWGRAFALAGFLFNGGFAGFAFITSLTFRDYQAELAWKNLFLSILVTQRGFLFALPAGLMLLASWRRRWQRLGACLPLWVEVVLYASMPLFHFHTFMFLSMMLGCWLVLGTNAIRRHVKFFHHHTPPWLILNTPMIRRHVLQLGLISLIPASFLVLLVTGSFKGPSFFKFQPGWMQGDSFFPLFWLNNFGLFIPLSAALLILLLLKGGNQNAMAFVLPACLVFLLCCFELFAPWEWDNTKLMLWSYLTLLPFIWRQLIYPCPKWARAGLCALLFFSGGISLIGGLKKSDYQLATISELDALSRPLSLIPVSARFAAAPSYNHPLLFMGRKVAMAYTGFLFGHGLPYVKAEHALNVLMLGDSGWRKAATELQTDYLFWGIREEETYPESTKAWAITSPVVASGSWGTLYKLFP